MTPPPSDDLCLRWRHDVRHPVFCANPTCPGRPARQLVDLAEIPDVTDELEDDRELDLDG